MSTAGSVGGVLLRIARKSFFLPASVAIKVLPMPVVARVPGAPPDLVGVALVEGEMVPVVALAELVPMRSGRDNRPMLVCSFHGERIGLVGLEIVATGKFTGDETHIDHQGERIEAFDVASVLARLKEGRWAV
jgi:chemotaxis signal transduction protein